MTRLSLVTGSLAATLAALPSLAGAQAQFHAQVTIPAEPPHPGCVRNGAGGTSNAPISAEGLCDLAGESGGLATADAHARQGHLEGGATAAKRFGGNDVPVSGTSFAHFIDREVTFSPIGGGPAPATITARLNLAFDGTLAVASGVFRSSAGVHMRAVMGRVDVLLIRHLHYDGATDVRDGNNFIVLAPALMQTPDIVVPVNSPDTIELHMEVAADAQREGSASSEHFLAFPTGMDVFVLPPGFTANAPASFIFNNRFVPPNAPPAPSSITVEPANPSRNVAQTQPFTATGTFADGSTQVLSSGIALPSGVVSWWPGDGNANDAADGNSAATVGGVAFAPGRVGQAFSFDGVDGDVWIATKPNLNVGLGDGFTIDAWILPSGPAEGLPSSGPIVEYGNGVHFWQHHLTDGPTGLIANLVEVGGSHHILEATGITQDAWNHVAVTYSKTTGVATLYVNGVAAASQNLGSFTPQTSTDLHIGRRLPGSFGGFDGFSFQGLIDEAEIYNRALSASEVQTIFNAGGTARCQPLAGCVTWSSSIPAVAPIDPAGMATAMAPGQTTVTATSSAAPAVSGSTTLTVLGVTDTIIDDTTPQSVLDAITNVPGCLVVVGTTRATLVLPNLVSIGICLTVTNNSDLTRIVMPNLTSAGCVTITNNPNLTTIDLGSLTSAGCMNITNNPALTEVGLTVGGGISGDVTVSDNTSASAVELEVGGGITGNVTASDNTSASTVHLAARSVGGRMTASGNSSAATIDMTVGTFIGGDVTITKNDVAADIDLASGGGIGGSVTISDNPTAADIDLATGGGIGGSVTIAKNGNATTTIDTPKVDGDMTVSTDGQETLDVSGTTVAGNESLSTRDAASVSAGTGGGTTTVTLANGPATMTAALPADAFSSRVLFTVSSVQGLTTSEGLDPASLPVTVSPLATYQFAFEIPTLNQDATLTFDIRLDALDAASQTALLAALASNLATLAVKGDAPSSVFQTFAVCAGQAPTAGGCVAVIRLDANGVVIPDGDPTVPTTVRFTGVTGHFSTFAVVIATPILDTTPPVISNVPTPIVAEATSAAGAGVGYALPTALDDRDGAVAVACAPASGSSFPLGTTTVVCGATDAAGNTSNGSFTVTVQDTTPPTLACPASQTAGATSASGAVVSYPPASVSDAVDAAPVVTYSQASGTLFPIGTTTVIVTARDAAGNSSTCSFSVTITPPGAGADLSVTNTDSPDPVTLGSPLTYTVTIRNNGPSQATQVWMAHALLGNVRLVSATASQGHCLGVPGLVTCNPGTLASGATATVTIVVVPKARGTLLSQAYVWSGVSDPHLANNQATASTRVR
jgi:uncharacterized repeat protein (TIGR01451 family)